jgi:hypothetical protein
MSWPTVTNYLWLLFGDVGQRLLKSVMPLNVKIAYVKQEH